jgi:16S rRNA (guanine527-N7)-methyltransferase
MLGESQLRELLAPFGVELTDHQAAQLMAYLDLLLRWNKRINLTAIRTAQECVTRHFGESLYLSRFTRLEGRLLDIGSGAGFPGLTLKIPFPELSATLLEPVAKKRAFLKEVARACGMDAVEVRAERLGEFVRQAPTASFDSATSRAVGHLEELVPLATRCLKLGGRLFLWLSREQGEGLRERLGARQGKEGAGVQWDSPMAIPLSRQGEIWCGQWKR